MLVMNDEIRAKLDAENRKMMEGLTIPDNIVRYVNLKYGTQDKRQNLDVYRPKNAQGKRLPVLINVHGGGWIFGDKDLYQFYAMSLALQGFAVVNINYRLAPEFKFPAQLEDINRVCGWVLEHQEDYLLDTDHIFMVGDSAGANLTAQYACILTNPKFAKNFPFHTPTGFSLLSVGLNMGMYDPAKDKIDSITESFLPLYLANEEEQRPLIGSCAYITPEFPIAFLMDSYGDFVRAQSALMQAALEKNEVQYVLRMFPPKQKHVFHIHIQDRIARICNLEECGFFKSLMAQ